jgi:UDP-N-acetylmuramate dehydrogenase
MFVMGFGSNLLISDDGLQAAVIRLEKGQFAQTQFAGEMVTAWAGTELSRLVLQCVEKGLSGIEALAGIPGTVAGAIKMNAGGNFGDIGAAVESVTLMDKTGKTFEKSKPELMFNYRQNNITAKFILNARMRLASGAIDQILKTVKEIWIYKKNSQPLNTKNSGCIFKNPRGISAGAIIDRAGLKGLKIGGARVSEKHANFFIAEPGCKSRDVLRLIDAVKERVKAGSDIDLELELEIWK